jgi:hypothetical protein
MSLHQKKKSSLREAKRRSNPSDGSHGLPRRFAPRNDGKTGTSFMLGWIAFSGFICIVCAVLGFSALVALSPMAQGLVLLVMAIAGMVLLGSFEAHEASRRDDA